MPITNNFKPAASVFVEILHPCHVAGEPVEVGDIVEVSHEAAGLICAAHRGKRSQATEAKKAAKPKKADK